MVTPLDHNGRAHAATIRSPSTRCAPGTGDLVYLVGSREAALALDPWFVPVDAAIVGIVDDVDATAEQLTLLARRRRLRSVATVDTHPSFDGRKLLIVQPLDENGAATGDSFLAVDMVQAGAGDTVLVNRRATASARS